MEMGSKKEIAKIEPQREIYLCPSCGYANGFHVSFQFNQKNWEAEVYLICPGCQSRFRIGWKVAISPVR